MPIDRKPATTIRPLPESGPDEADRQAADEVADADHRLQGRPVLGRAEVPVAEGLVGID